MMVDDSPWMVFSDVLGWVYFLGILLLFNMHVHVPSSMVYIILSAGLHELETQICYWAVV
jgi:hypothetical protein